MSRHRDLPVLAAALLAAAACRTTPRAAAPEAPRRWLAGDHHIHSRFSADYPGADTATTAPVPVLGADGRYAIPTNAAKAREHGLAWMVATDHGGPLHSKLSYEQAYPELLRSRSDVPEVIQFYGMEFDTPGADHSSLIVPHSHHERDDLLAIESRFSKRDAFPRDPARDAEPRMLAALRMMRDMAEPPVVIANHPSRSARGFGEYGQDTPAELRAWNDTAPRVAIGMEGAPGHQAGAIDRDGSIDSTGVRGGYRNAPTMGGFDQMTARLGGFWDAMLGEGRRWWITSTSDSHRNWRDGGSDFWPGEYSKTYVHARRSHADILDGLRGGRVFVTTGDLIAELDVTAEAVAAPGRGAGIGGSLALPGAGDVRVTIRVRDPEAPNARGERPSVNRVDLIMGHVVGRSADRTLDHNPTTQVIRRFGPRNWTRDGEWLTMTHVVPDVHHTSYLRVRGTSTDEWEPRPDTRGEDPWSDLWFYSNPIFVDVR